jgi:uncharacterized protein YqjF (DUF2071 family)
MARIKQIFLSAEWRDLVMLNFEVDPALLAQYLPHGTTLDSFQGKTYVSLVGFRFCRTRILGSLAIPFHSNFDEANLRFYVRRHEGSESRRGVVFIAEIVPRRAVAAVARVLYGENYVCFPMRHHLGADASKKVVAYQWRLNGRWCKLSADAFGAPELPQEESLEQFITEHYWGYSKQRATGSLEYRVTHARWRVWVSLAAGFEGDASSLYGVELAKIIQGRPASAFIAEGSPVVVFRGRKIA